MKLHFKLLCLLGIMLPAICSAQGDFRTGFIIKNNGDSLAGFVDYRVGGKAWTQASFRASKKGVTEKYSADEIKAYGFRGNKRFESISLPKQSTRGFAECLVKGMMSVYRHKGQFYIKKDSIILLSKGETQIIESTQGKFYHSKNTYKGILNLLLSDCNLKADKTPLNESSLVSLAQNYNRCKGAPGKRFKEEQPDFRVNYYAVAGINLTSFTTTGLDKNAFRKDYSMLLGAGMDLSLPRLTDRILLSLEIDYTSYSTHGYHEVHNAAKITRSDYFLKASYLRVPVGFRYNFFHESRTPYIKAGLLNLIDLGSDFTGFEDYEENHVVTTTNKTYKLKSANQAGYWLSVGFGQVISGPIKGFLEIRYELINGFTGHEIVDNSKLTTTSVIFGIRL